MKLRKHIYKSIGKHHGFELTIENWSFKNQVTILDINNQFSWNRDHGGFRFSITILNQCLEFNYCDGRHWNHDENRYFRPDDPDTKPPLKPRNKVAEEFGDEVYEFIEDNGIENWDNLLEKSQWI